jgi:hypothetical protein
MDLVAAKSCGSAETPSSTYLATEIAEELKGKR